MCALEQAMSALLKSKLIFKPCRVQIAYTATMLLVLVSASILSLCAPPLGANCDQASNWHW